MAGIWVFSEQQSTLLELVGGGRRLADALGLSLTAVAVGPEEMATAAIACGADEAIALAVPAGQPLETAAGTLADLLRQADADVALAGATLRGKDLAARTAAKLGTALAGEASNLRLADGRLVIDRMVLGGGGVATQHAISRPQMATIPPRSLPAPAPQERSGAVRTVAVPADGRVKVVERRAKEAQGVDIADAPAVVGVGRGLANQADLALMEELAAAMGGAVGCTRPVAEDLGWLPEERYIGISGKKIAPAVYLAVGASGQVQHVAGVRDAKVIVAINKDENAPIFKMADYGIVGDLTQVVPALTAELKKLLG